MNDYLSEIRKRSQTLLIVEGHHEKNELFWLIFKCFPEVGIDMDNVWIYGTNIYMLYEDIVKEYGADWAEEGLDIDLPFVVSKKHAPNNLRYKDDFTNVILVFDYERHDPNFSKTKIMQMQKVFSDATDMGKLYINYPMIESYQHLKEIPDCDYAERKIPVSLQPGSRYKELVGQETVIGKLIDFPHRVDDLLNEHFKITNGDIRKRCCEGILNLSDTEHIEEELQDILRSVIRGAGQKTLIYQMKDWINKAEYAKVGQTYWQYARSLLLEIIYHNICKANRIQNGIYNIEIEQYKGCYENLELEEILKKQNLFSNSSDGYVWVLNTCVFVIPDYNFSLVQKGRNLKFIYGRYK